MELPLSELTVLKDQSRNAYKAEPSQGDGWTAEKSPQYQCIQPTHIYLLAATIFWNVKHLFL